MVADTQLIIFDCDGVLIDSEFLVCRLTSEELTRLGYRISVEDVIARFAGRSEASLLSEVARDWGRPVPSAYSTRMKSRVASSYASDLEALPGVTETLGLIQCGICVASSSDPDKLRLGLRSTGLLDVFGDNVLSASRVAKGKPEPDIFLYAAGWMRTPVANCLIVEDSVPGIQAARSAGMRAIGFVGGRHCDGGQASRLLSAGAECVIGHMSELGHIAPDAFRSVGEASVRPVRASDLAAIRSA